MLWNGLFDETYLVFMVLKNLFGYVGEKSLGVKS